MNCMTCLLMALGPWLIDAEDPFSAGVRTTPPRTPAEERQGLRLPPGFEIELVAAEPDIQKPMNLAFDARGRLWVSGSTEYPFAAPPGRPARDSIRILEDTNGDGRYDRTKIFADGLNIPIGLLPYKNGVIAYSIPNIEYLEDTDGDDRMDRRHFLYGPLAYDRDTHGMNNAFRPGADGWIYACHGWANHSTLAGKDGHRIDLQGGNTYRFRPDGSRVELFTQGQVNPFGLTIDWLGDWFSADCHTRPIMLLLRRGCYDSFGRPHNGLGYVPNVMEHSHGSTAIAGTACYTAGQFPPEFRGNMFSGNVMTCRVNRNRIERIGATVRAIEQPDFIVSDDPWFRPVDLQVAPDGSLYIADFYNRIIGHVEVPLHHPGRDRVRGRIWKVSYLTGSRSPSSDLRQAAPADLVAAFEHPVLSVAQRASDELVNRIGPAAISSIRPALQSKNAAARARALWTLARLGDVQSNDLTHNAADADPLVRVHAQRVLAELPKWSTETRNLARRGLADGEAMTRRAALDALGCHPDTTDIAAVIVCWRQAAPDDAHLRHQVKLTLLEIARLEGALARQIERQPSADEAALLAEVSLALPTAEAGRYALWYLEQHRPGPDRMRPLLTHAASLLPAPADSARLARLARQGFANELDLQLDLLFAMRSGLEQRGIAETDELRRWGEELARRLLASALDDSAQWISFDPAGGPGKPWKLERRACAGGGSDWFLSSLPNGERYRGTLKSRRFTIPKELHFYLCGHLGFPERPPILENRVRLCLANGQVIAEALPPRSDTAVPVAWKLDGHAGQTGYLEVVDGVRENAYAWLAVSRFDPKVVSVPRVDPELVARRQKSAAILVRSLGLADQVPALEKVAKNSSAAGEARIEAARAILSFRADPARLALVEIANDPVVAPSLREEILSFAPPADAAGPTLLARALRAIPWRLQLTVAERLARSTAGAELLLEAVANGNISPAALREPAIRDPLLASRLPGISERLALATKGLPPRDVELERVLAARRDQVKARPLADPAAIRRGTEVFTKNCAACHQIANQGAIVGPQLDGIGERGLERILEDVIDPARNVDPQFKTTIFVLKGGTVFTVLVRRREGDRVVVVDSKGKESAVLAEDIEESRASDQSLMPTNFAAVLSEADLADLMAFLLSQRRSGVSGQAH